MTTDKKMAEFATLLPQSPLYEITRPARSAAVAFAHPLERSVNWRHLAGFSSADFAGGRSHIAAPAIRLAIKETQAW